MNPLTEPGQGHRIPVALQGLRALVIGVFEPGGKVLEANAGFRDLTPAEASAGDWNCAGCLVNPTLDQLRQGAAADAQGPVYRGLMTVRDGDDRYHSMTGSVFRQEGLFFLVAEHDVAGLEQLGASVSGLNEELTQTQRQMSRINRQLEEQRELYRKASITDMLTGLFNRRYFITTLSHELERSDRYGSSLSLVMCDIDHFKRINDGYGHDQGDVVLQAFAGVLQEDVRGSDIAARYGGEEFIVLLAENPLPEAVQTAERLRRKVESLVIGETPISVTASFGVAQYRGGESMEELLRRVDTALYRAKERGRNRVVEAADGAG